MNQTQITETAKKADELFRLVMNIYWTYLEKLEVHIQELPETETEKINKLYEHVEEVKSALEHDIALFDEAINSDKEDIQEFNDQLKINDIYKKLKN